MQFYLTPHNQVLIFGSDFYLKSFQSDQIEGWDLFNWIGWIGRLASEFENGRHSMDGAL